MLQDFQSQIKSLKKNGVILALASKNDEKTALEVFDKHPEMLLSINDFVTYRINWEDKARNIRELSQELDPGLDSFVFWDDNPIDDLANRT